VEPSGRWLAAARNYWVCTTRPDRRPHAKPVWGIWLEGDFLFSTHPETVTARNLTANPALVVHLESGEQVMIVEGTAKRLDDRALLARFGEAYEAKYDWPLSPQDLDPRNPDAAFYA
jgi:general stress protein 26